MKEVKILGITSSQRIDEFPEVKTFIEQGVDVEFANWRGFFVNASVPAEKVMLYRKMFKQLHSSVSWQKSRKKHHWQPLFLEGAQLAAFLTEQERMMQQALFNLEIE